MCREETFEGREGDMKKALNKWEGGVAVVTGASSGIGRQIAIDLVRVGMKVAAVARRKERLTQIKASMDKDGFGEMFVPFAYDLRDAESIPKLFSEVEEKLGPVDVLVNNAGLGYREPLMSGNTLKWKEILDVNVLALCVCTREAVTSMVKRGVAGYVIHISSMSGHRVTFEGGVYTGAKHAVRALTEGLRRELRAADSRVRVTAVSPGFVETEFADKFHQSSEKAREVYSSYPCLQPVDISRSVLFLLSQPEHVEYHDLLVRPTGQPT